MRRVPNFYISFTLLIGFSMSFLFDFIFFHNLYALLSVFDCSFRWFDPGVYVMCKAKRKRAWERARESSHTHTHRYKCAHSPTPGQNHRHGGHNVRHYVYAAWLSPSHFLFSFHFIYSDNFSSFVIGIGYRENF